MLIHFTKARKGEKMSTKFSTSFWAFFRLIKTINLLNCLWIYYYTCRINFKWIRNSRKKAEWLQPWLNFLFLHLKLYSSHITPHRCLRSLLFSLLLLWQIEIKCVWWWKSWNILFYWIIRNFCNNFHNFLHLYLFSSFWLSRTLKLSSSSSHSLKTLSENRKFFQSDCSSCKH